MKRNAIAAVIAGAGLLAGGHALASGPPKLDSALAAYKTVSGVSGNLSSIGSDSLNNVMSLWAETFGKFYPNTKIQIEGKGSSTAPPFGRCPRRLRQQGQPRQVPHPGPGRCDLLQVAAAGRQGGHQDLGPARADRRVGGEAHQPVRQELGLGHVRVLQGSHAQERRLQGRGQRAAGIRLGRSGHHRRPLRHGV